MEFIQFRTEHLALLRMTGFAAAWRDALLSRPEEAKSLEVPLFSWTGVVDDEIVGCAGIVHKWTGVGHAWAVLGAIPRRDFVSVVAKVRREFAASHYERIEASVVWGFGDGCRFAKAVGMTVEGLAKKYRDGTDHFLYSWVRP